MIFSGLTISPVLVIYCYLSVIYCYISHVPHSSWPETATSMFSKLVGIRSGMCGLAGSSALEPVMVSRYPLGCPVGSSHTGLFSVLQTCWSCCCPGPLNWLFPPQESSSSRFLYCWALGFPDGSAGKKPACQCRRHKRHEFEALTSFKALLKHHVLLAVYPGKITQSPEPLISFIFFCFSITVLIY